MTSADNDDELKHIEVTCRNWGNLNYDKSSHTNLQFPVTFRARTVAEAQILAITEGWGFDPRTGWTCPNCRASNTLSQLVRTQDFGATELSKPKTTEAPVKEIKATRRSPWRRDINELFKVPGTNITLSLAGVASRYAKGESAQQIADSLHLHKSTIFAYLNSAGVKLSGNRQKGNRQKGKQTGKKHRSPVPLTDEMKKEVLERYIAGESGTKIAKSMKVTTWTVYSFLNTQGYSRKEGTCHLKRTKSRSTKKLQRAQRNTEICNYYLSGHSLDETGTAFAITRERVRQILVKNGVTERHFESVLSREARQQARQNRALIEETKKRINNEMFDERVSKWAEAVQLYLDGYSYLAIQDKLGISTMTQSALYRDLGIQRGHVKKYGNRSDILKKVAEITGLAKTAKRQKQSAGKVSIAKVIRHWTPEEEQDFAIDWSSGLPIWRLKSKYKRSEKALYIKALRKGLTRPEKEVEVD